MEHEIRPGDLVMWRHDMGRGPLHYDVTTWRYGVAQRRREATGEDVILLQWHGMWPSDRTRAEAEESLAYYQSGNADRRYDFCIVVYPPELPAAERRMEAA